MRGGRRTPGVSALPCGPCCFRVQAGWIGGWVSVGRTRWAQSGGDGQGGTGGVKRGVRKGLSPRRRLSASDHSRGSLSSPHCPVGTPTAPTRLRANGAAGGGRGGGAGWRSLDTLPSSTAPRPPAARGRVGGGRGSAGCARPRRARRRGAGQRAPLPPRRPWPCRIHQCGRGGAGDALSSRARCRCARCPCNGEISTLVASDSSPRRQRGGRCRSSV